MSKVVLYIAQSIDGYIADVNGELNWLENLPNPDQTDHGYGALLESIETIFMGKNTYNSLLSFDIEWPYASFKTYVVSNNIHLKASTPDTEIFTGDIEKEIQHLKQNTYKDIWLVGGGVLINYFLNKKLIDKIILAIAPVTLGNGIPMFPGVSLTNEWNLKNVESFNTGIVLITYDKK